MNRIDERFEMLKKEGRKAFIPYICGGDPTLEETEKIIYALEEAGCDVIELGVPFSDPVADGPVIQEASARALNAGFKIDKYFETVKNIRKKSQIPMVAMVYYSTIFGYGKEKFIKNAIEAGLDGMIIPELPYEETDEIMPLLEGTEFYLIPFVSVTSKDRIPMLVENAKGFIYCISSLGVTGEREFFDERVQAYVDSVKKHTDTPVCIGFGISTRKDVTNFNKYADGVIVGTALVKKINENINNLEVVKDFIKELTK